MAVQPIRGDHVGFSFLVGGQKLFNFDGEGISNPAFIHVHHHAMGGFGGLRCFLVKLAVGASLSPLLMVLVCVEQMNLGVMLGNGREDRPGLFGGVIVEANKQIAKPLIKVMVNEFRDIGAFIGGNGDYITAIGYDFGSIKQA